MDFINTIFVNNIKTFDESGEFKGTVFNDVLPEELYNEFEFDSQDIDNVFELSVKGKFDFETTENGLILLRLIGLALSDGNRTVDLDLDKLDGNELYELEERLVNSSEFCNIEDENESF